jgi:hypothetical protein
MAVVFWDSKGMPTVEFMQQVITITSEIYYQKLKELHRAIQNKRLGMLTYGVVLFVSFCTYARTRALLEHFNCELFDQPPYSPDLAPRGLPEELVEITALQQ